MNKKELIIALEGLPDDLPIWLGTENCEGLYETIEHVFKGNSVALPLDCDCMTGEEQVWFDDDQECEKLTNGCEKNFVIDGDCVHFDVIVLGNYRSKENYDTQMHEFVTRDERVLAEQEKELQRLQDDMVRNAQRIAVLKRQLGEKW